LMVILLPVLARSTESSRQATCLSNLRRIGGALGSYALAWDGHQPDALTAFAATQGRPVATTEWYQRLGTKLLPPEALLCPSHLPGMVETGGRVKPLPTTYSFGSWLTRGTRADLRRLRIPGRSVPFPFDKPADPSHVIQLADSDGFPLSLSAYREQRLRGLFEHFGQRANLLFYDGHVEQLHFRQTLSPRFLWWERADSPTKREMWQEMVSVGWVKAFDPPGFGPGLTPGPANLPRTAGKSSARRGG
ncbi:MAG TPA: hypothetical protein VGN26_22670, partial [Armatimonadota bacterium]